MARSETLPVLLKQLRLSTMAQLWETFLTRAAEENWDPAQYLAALCEHELNERYSRRIARFTKESRLPIGKTLATFDFSQTPEISPERVAALAQNSDWVKRAGNLLFFGPQRCWKNPPGGRHSARFDRTVYSCTALYDHCTCPGNAAGPRGFAA